MQMARRLEAMGQPKYIGTTRVSGGRAKWNGVVRIDQNALDVPKSWRKGRLIFVNSMSDLFHDEVPLEFIRSVFEVIHQTPQHTYQVLTKRSERLKEISGNLNWPDNLWMGVSVENEDYIHRICHLKDTSAKVKFLSLEPLLGPLNHLQLKGIDWVIAGGESGSSARPIRSSWVRSIRDQCTSTGTAFQFKQWGGKNKKKAGRMLDGRTWDELPVTR